MLRENNKVWCSNCTAKDEAPRCKGCYKPIIAGSSLGPGLPTPGAEQRRGGGGEALYPAPSKPAQTNPP